MTIDWEDPSKALNSVLWNLAEALKWPGADDDSTWVEQDQLLSAATDAINQARGDEHSQEVSLLQMTLRDAQAEIVRLRGDRIPLVVQLGQGGTLPSRVHAGDAGFDLYVSEQQEVGPGQFVDIHCDIRVQMPVNMWAMIVGRSSTLRKRGLLVAQGIIDSGYRGELFCGVWNLTQEPVAVRDGERLAQLIPFKLDAGQVQLATGLVDAGPDGRGVLGFGSSGT